MSSSKRASIKKKSPLDSLFNRQETEAAVQETNRPEVQKAAPPEEKDEPSYRKTSLLVTEEQLFWLDEKCFQARKEGGKALHKAEIIRALIEVARSAPIDFSNLNSEEELARRLGDAIRSA